MTRALQCRPRRGPLLSHAPSGPGEAATAAGTAILAVLLILSAAPPAAGGGGSATQGAFPDLPWGAGGAVFGSGACAWSRDPAALSWNPARTLRVPGRQLMGGTGDLYDLGLVRHSFVAATFPVYPKIVTADGGGRLQRRAAETPSRAWSVGADILELDAVDDIYRETRISLAYAAPAMRRSAIGLRVSYLSIGGDLDELGASGYDLDLGFDTVLHESFQLGVVVRHLLSSVSWDAGDSERLNLRIAGGLVYRLHPVLSLPLGAVYDPEGVGLQEVSLGAEYRPLGDLAALLAGVRHRPEDLEDTLVSGGVALARGPLRAAYGLVSDEAGLGSTHRFDVTFAF
ncbi:MAG: hypothetical protein GF355_08215 [Candidatus Eisenbacteria bacterium]|nr:hypothetical protein [Candidatus Eisenbacteria bacterium]